MTGPLWGKSTCHPRITLKRDSVFKRGCFCFCLHEKAGGQVVDLPVIWNAAAFMWRNFNMYHKWVHAAFLKIIILFACTPIFLWHSTQSMSELDDSRVTYVVGRWRSVIQSVPSRSLIITKFPDQFIFFDYPVARIAGILRFVKYSFECICHIMRLLLLPNNSTNICTELFFRSIDIYLKDISFLLISSSKRCR